MVSFVAGFMLGVLAVGAWYLGDEVSSSFFQSYSGSQGEKTLPESGAVSIGNQPAGSVVVVDTVTVPPPGVWIAVREVVGGSLGNVLGAVRVNGPRTAVEIQLLRATEPNLSYAVELYRDDGDSSFDLATDSVYIDFATGAPVVAHFTTTP